MSDVSNDLFHLFCKTSRIRVISIGNMFISRLEHREYGDILSDCCKQPELCPSETAEIVELTISSLS
jgi:hypothetical protein